MVVPGRTYPELLPLTGVRVPTVPLLPEIPDGRTELIRLFSFERTTLPMLEEEFRRTLEFPYRGRDEFPSIPDDT